MTRNTGSPLDTFVSELAHKTSVGPGPAAPDNASASQSGPGDDQQAAHWEALNLLHVAAEDAAGADWLSARPQDQPPGPAVIQTC
ncbi:hypothetical protein ACT3TB_16275 [Micrococcaceae sp. AOP34-BR2-30]